MERFMHFCPDVCTENQRIFKIDIYHENRYISWKSDGLLLFEIIKDGIEP